MRRWFARNAAAAVVALVLGAAGVGATFVNASAGPPRTLFLKLPSDAPEPTLTLAARQHANGGWQLEIAATGFRFTAICLPTAAAAPVGHAHVFMDGAKVASAFVPVVDLGQLTPGRHAYRVVLRGQDHRVLVGRDGVIEAELTIAVP